MLREAVENARLMFCAGTADDPVVQMVQKFAEALYDLGQFQLKHARERPSTISASEERQLGQQWNAQWGRVNDLAGKLCATRAFTDQAWEAKCKVSDIYSAITGRTAADVPERDFGRSIMDDYKHSRGLGVFAYNKTPGWGATPVPAPAVAPAPRPLAPSVGGL